MSSTSGTDYVSGQLSGKAVGFQAKSSLIPVPTLPVVRTETNKVRELKTIAVDQDRIGVSDGKTVVRVATAPLPTQVASSPTIVRLAGSSSLPNQIQLIGQTLPVQQRLVQSVLQPTVIRTASSQAVLPREEFFAVPQVGAAGQIDQFFQDLQFQSVDTDEDGIPDQVVRLASVPVTTFGGRFI